METITPLVLSGIIADRSTVAGWVVAIIPPWSRAVWGVGNMVSVSPSDKAGSSFAAVTAPLASSSVDTAPDWISDAPTAPEAILPAVIALAPILTAVTALSAISSVASPGTIGRTGTENDNFSGVIAALAISSVATGGTKGLATGVNDNFSAVTAPLAISSVTMAGVMGRVTDGGVKDDFAGCNLLSPDRTIPDFGAGHGIISNFRTVYRAGS